MASGFGLYVNVPATTAGNTVVKGAPCQLRRIVVLTTGTGSGTFVSVYDNATTNSGNVLFSFPSNAAAGTIYEVELPAAVGITVAQVTNGPGLNVVWN